MRAQKLTSETFVPSIASTVTLPKHNSVEFLVDPSSRLLPAIFGRYKAFCAERSFPMGKGHIEETHILENEDIGCHPSLSAKLTSHIQVMKIASSGFLYSNNDCQYTSSKRCDYYNEQVSSLSHADIGIHELLQAICRGLHDGRRSLTDPQRTAKWGK